MKKRLVLLSFILAAASYGSDSFFYEGEGEKNEVTSVRLEESVISASGFETTVRNTPKNLTVISREDMQTQNFSEVSEVLERVPGVAIYENVFGTFIDLRGQGVDKAKSNVQILVDGVNINPLDPAHGVLPLDTIPVDSIERIEVLPGGGSVLYGDGTVGGVVNIITKVEAGKTYNTIGARYGSDATKEFNIAAGDKITDKLTLQVAYDNKSTNGYREGADSDKEFFEGAINYQFNEKNRVTFRYSRSEEEGHTPKALTREEVDEDRKQSGGTGDRWNDPDKTELTRDAFNLNYESGVTERLTFELNTSYQRTENVWSSYMETYPGFFPGMLPSVAQKSKGTFKDEKIQVSPKLKYQYGEESDIIFGFDYKNAEGSREGEPGYLGRYNVYDYEFEKESFAGYVYNTTRYGKFELAQGYRREKTKYSLDRYQEDYAKTWPKPLPPQITNPKVETFSEKTDLTNDAFDLSLNYLYSDTGNTYARFEAGFRNPQPTEFVDKAEDGSGYSMNDLDGEEYKTFEIGVKDYVFSSYVSLSLFYTETEDEIGQNGEMPNYWSFYNMGKTRRMGVEGFAEQYLGRFTLTESFSIIDAEIREGSKGSHTNGNTIPGVSKYSANITVKYDITPRLNSSVNVGYKSGYYLDEANDSGKQNDRIVTDLTVNYVFDSGLKLYAGINNIFDERYYDSMGYSEAGEFSYNPAAERNYFTGVQYNF